MRHSAPVRLEGLQYQLDAGRERHEPVRAGAHRRLLVALVADLFDVLLGHDPAGAGRVRVEGEKVGPGLLQAETHPAGIGRLDRGDAFLERLGGGAPVALEGELDVLGRDGLAVVELHPFSKNEVVREAVLRCRPRLGGARRLRVAGHWLQHGVVERVQEHVRRDDAGRLGRIEPGGRDRHVNSPRHLARRSLGRGPSGCHRDESCEQEDESKARARGSQVTGRPSSHRALLCVANRSRSEPRTTNGIRSAADYPRMAGDVNGAAGAAPSTKKRGPGQACSSRAAEPG